MEDTLCILSTMFNEVFNLHPSLLINWISIFVKFYDPAEKFLRLFSHQNFLPPPNCTFPISLENFFWKFYIRYYRERVRDIFPSQRGSIAGSIAPGYWLWKKKEKEKKGSGKMVGFEGKIVDSSRINIITDVDDDDGGDEAKRKTSMQSVTSHLFTTSIRWTCRNNLAR